MADCSECVSTLYSLTSLLTRAPAVIFVLFPSIDFISSLVIAACLTPTDPIISAAILGAFRPLKPTICANQSVIGGRFAAEHVPPKLRHIVSAESAANDGLAYPFLSISMYLTVEASRGVAFEKWVLIGWFCK